MTETRPDNKKMIGFSEIKEKYLPHRYPIVLLDRITDYKAGEFIEAIKCVTGNSPELVGHFPDRAIMPATSIVQADGCERELECGSGKDRLEELEFRRRNNRHLVIPKRSS